MLETPKIPAMTRNCSGRALGGLPPALSRRCRRSEPIGVARCGRRPCDPASCSRRRKPCQALQRLRRYGQVGEVLTVVGVELVPRSLAGLITMKTPMWLQTAGMLLFVIFAVIASVAISPWFFEYVIGEREFYRIVILAVLLSLYGMFCKASGRLCDEDLIKDAQYNKIIVGAGFLLASFIVFVTTISQSSPDCK